MQDKFKPLTNAQIAILATIIEDRKRKHDIFKVIEAIFWIVRTGCQWRNIDSKYGDYRIPYYYFNTWSKNGKFMKMNQMLVKIERKRLDKSEVPTVGSIDSQSVKIAPFIPKDKGIDGGKKVNGRKRHIITDTNGLILGAKVGAANEHDGKGGSRVYMENFKFLSALVHVFGDNAYGGVFRKLMTKHKVKLEIAAKPESTKGFVPVAVRWVTERTFGWFNFYRRLSKDYERNVENSVSVIYIAQIQILLNRLDEVKN